jgi:uncharacterized membrane protein YccC
MRRALAALLIVTGAFASVSGQTPEAGGLPREGKRPWLAGRPGEGRVGENAAFENVRRALEALTPEQRKRFQENLVRWANMSPEEKKALREREETRKQTIEQETNAAIQESGLQLDADRREQFVKRYTEGRRAIEEQLHKELVEKRKPLVRELVNRLRAEFASEGTPALPTPSQQTTIQTVSPSTSAKP